MGIDFEFKDRYNFYDLVKILKVLRSENGCAWDKVQTHESIKKNLIEETYETIEAINKQNPDMLCEELGDMLMQVVFHAQIEEELGSFNIDDVADGNCKKLVERHPHVFGDVKADSEAAALSSWDAVKRKTKGQKTTSDAIDSVPRELPALMRADKIQSKASKAGFDWKEVEGAIDKLYEEIGELKEAISSQNQPNVKEELGDVLFSVVNVSRFVDVDAEEALADSTDKFVSRFRAVEKMAAERNIDMKSAELTELDELWDEAKSSM